MDLRLDEKKLYYHSVVSVWEGFCHLHKELYDLTCDEYLTLLSSDVDKLEDALPHKEEIIRKISALEYERKDLIESINTSKIFTKNILKSSDLLIVFSEIDQSSAMPALKNLNALLIDIVRTIGNIEILLLLYLAIASLFLHQLFEDQKLMSY